MRRRWGETRLPRIVADNKTDALHSRRQKRVGAGVKTVIWTDGSCNANGLQGRGGWAALIEQEEEPIELSGSANGTTQNRMELTAVCEALETLTGTIEV